MLVKRHYGQFRESWSIAEQGAIFLNGSYILRSPPFDVYYGSAERTR